MNAALAANVNNVFTTRHKRLHMYKHTWCCRSQFVCSQLKMATIIAQVKNISYRVKTSHQYNEISNELFNTQNPTKYIHIFQMFTYFVLKKGSIEKKRNHVSL